MDILKLITNTIYTIWNAISSVFSFFHNKKIEQVTKVELAKEEVKTEKVIDTATKDKNIDKLNDLAGWKN